MTCSHNTTLGFGDFDYYKISSYMVYTTSGPKRILVDQSNQRFRLEPGDVFGVRFPHFGPTAALKTSSSGSTLFYSSSMVNDTNSTTLRGNRFPLTAESPSQMSYTLAIAFFYSVDSESKLEHVYQNIGHANVLTSIGNSITRVNYTKSICLQEDIKGLQSYFPEVFPFGEAVNVTGGISQGSNVTFYWDFGDKNNATSLIPWVTHVFNHTVGLKTVSIIAGNDIRVEAVWCTVLVQERILGLQFKDTTLLSIENGTTAEIAWILLNGSHVDFTLNITYPDGFIVSKNLTNVKAPAATFFGKYNTTLTQPGWYRIEITASNRLDNVTLVGNLSVQRVVHGVTMDSPKILKTNQTFNFTIPPHQGDEVRYLLNTMDGNIINTTERLIPFVYTKAGRYDAYLIASNDISSVAVKCGQIIVQDVIEGLQFISFNHTVAVHAQAEINWILTQGSELEILVNYGDESSTFVNRSVSVGDVFVAISKHNYSKPGEYLVTINVTNLVDSEEINTTVYVETPGNGVILAIGRYNLSTAGNDSCEGILYVRVNDSVTATATVENGTNVYGYMDFGGNSSVRVRYFHREFPGEGWTERYSYSLAGEYNITITFSNRNPGDVNQFCRVIVQNPINVVMVTSDSPKKRTERNLTFTVSFPGSLQPSGPLRYQWRYGDDTAQEPVKDNRTEIHSYPNRCGVYIATVNVSNAISFGLGQAEVVVQDEVKDLKWSANYTKLNVDYSGECSNFVRRNDTFPFDYAVAFSASANGTNVSYTWSFPEDVNNTNSSCTHKFKKEGKNQIVLTAENAVSSETKIILLKLVEDIWNVSFVNDGPSTQNSQVNFTLSMTRKGEGSFFHIDFKDSSIKKKIFKSPKSTYRHGGDDADEVRVRKNQTFGVTYKNVGKYPVSLHARNNVSCVYQVSEVAVARGFCTYPVISVPGFKEGEKRKFKRSEKISIKTDTKLNCFNYSTTLRWEIVQKCDGQQPIQVTELLKNKGIDVDRSELLIPARFFNYCSEVEARFTVNMTEAPGVSKVKTIKFEITESPLRAIIYGGSERTVGNNRSVEIDATDSYDPDAKTRERTDQNWKFAWFCHQIDEKYSLPANLTDLPPVPTPEPPTNWTGNFSTVNATNGTRKDLGGCFGLGPGRLNFSLLKITFHTSEMKSDDSYVIIFAMDKKERKMQSTTQRIVVKPGDPPTLTIR